jgi:uncharacterized protein YqfB (UPF0267 family)
MWARKNDSMYMERPLHDTAIMHCTTANISKQQSHTHIDNLTVLITEVYPSHYEVYINTYNIYIYKLSYAHAHITEEYTQ